MSAYLVGRILWADLPAHLKLTAVIIADAANDEGYAYPGQHRIATQLGQSDRQVRSNIRELQERGLLSVVHRGKKGSNQSGGRTSNGYQINLDTLPHPPYRQSGLPVSEEITECSGLIGNALPVNMGDIGSQLPVSGEVTGSPAHTYRKSCAGLPEVATSYEPSEEPSVSMSKPASRIPTCPHLEIIRIYHRILPERPRIVESRWKGSASERNLKARWTEDERHRNLPFWEKLFGVVRTNDWWMGRGDWKGADLHWLIRRGNFDKVIQHGVNLNPESGADAH